MFNGKPSFVWDLETDGLLGDVTAIWCMGVKNLDTGEREIFTNYDPTHRSLEDGFNLISGAGEWINHNIIPFDMRVLESLFPGQVKEADRVYDTLLLSRLLYADIHEYRSLNKGLSKGDKYKHSLGAWGQRLGDKKGEFDDWSQYTKAMGDYCLQDLEVTERLWLHLRERMEHFDLNMNPWSDDGCVGIEHQFLRYTLRQTETGIPFNIAAAEELVAMLLGKQEELLKQLQDVFPPQFWYKELKTKCNIGWAEFNPASRQQVGERLVAAGWEPLEYTKGGQPKVDEDALEGCEIPEAQAIAEYLSVDKRLGMLANGKNAWLKLVGKDGRIHGLINTLLAVTGRVSHAHPNLSQVPSVKSWLGNECRALFTSRKGWKMVGADLSGIELRALAHYLYYWDNGEYREHVLHGDVHTVHQQAFGLPPGPDWRGVGKSGTLTNRGAAS